MTPDDPTIWGGVLHLVFLVMAVGRLFEKKNVKTHDNKSQTPAQQFIYNVLAILLSTGMLH